MKKELSPELKALQESDIKFNAAYHDENKIDDVQLPFLPAVWADLLNKEGKYLGACCSTISEMRDILQNALREDGYIRCDDLKLFVDLARSHDNDNDRKESDPDNDNDPILVAIKLWEKIEPYAQIKHKPDSVDHNNVTEAAEIVYSCCGNVAWDEINGSHGSYHDIVQRTRMLCEVLPAITTLYKHLLDLDLGSVDGIACCKKETGMVLEIPKRGYAIFSTQAKADEFANYWKKKNVDIVFRPCRVSVANGIEWLASYMPPAKDPDEFKEVTKCLQENLQQLVQKAAETLPKHWNLHVSYDGHLSVANDKDRFHVKLTPPSE